MPWLDPPLVLRWGPYSRPDGAEQAQIVTMTVAAKVAGLITRKMAVEKFADAGVFDVDNVDGVIAELDKEKAENDAANAKSEADQAENDAKTLHAAGVRNAKGKPRAPGQPGGSGAASQD